MDLICTLNKYMMHQIIINNNMKLLSMSDHQKYYMKSKVYGKQLAYTHVVPVLALLFARVAKHEFENIWGIDVPSCDFFFNDNETIPWNLE